MNFTTTVPITKAENPISYSSKILSLGSCFAENMGEKFSYFKFQNVVNPFGIIFNPASIEQLINRVVNKSFYSESDIFFHNDLWHCYDVHSQLSHPDKEIFLSNLNNLIESTHNQLTYSTHIIITYGTSWVYSQISGEGVVANCHKVSQHQFEKEILPVEIITMCIQETIDLIRKINPNCTFIFTVSPVRHIKDGFVENQRSKAHLIAAIHNAQLATLNAQYFPSYEIMMDELRDYRFYAEDMLHPSQVAIDYIWERFFENYIAVENHTTMEEVCSIQKSLLHRPFNPDSESHQKFLAALNQKIAKLQERFPYFKF